LQADAARIDAENMQAQQQMMKDLSDAVRAYINEYNKTAGYDVIFDRAATLYIGEAYNITQDIIKGLNNKDKKEAVAATDTTATK
jgi:Skp family chaperone for outer membrane proteins